MAKILQAAGLAELREVEENHSVELAKIKAQLESQAQQATEEHQSEKIAKLEKDILDQRQQNRNLKDYIKELEKQVGIGFNVIPEPSIIT